MKLKLKIPKRDLVKEIDFKERVKEQYLQWKADLLEKAKSVNDLRELRRIMDELDKNQFDWSSSTGEWLEKGEAYDIICLTIKLPGLKKNRIRYVIYGILSFSKGLTDSFDHLGDLERIMYIKNERGVYFAFSTIGHGYLELFPEILGQKNSFEELMSEEEYVFEVGDHSLCTERDNTKILIGKVPFIDIFRIIKTNIYKDHVYKKIPLLSNLDIEKKLEINWFNYGKEIIKIDKIIDKKIKSYSIAFRIKRALNKAFNFIKKRREIDYLYLLNAIKSTLWNVPPTKQDKIVRKIIKELEKISNKKQIDEDIISLLNGLLRHLDNLVDPIEFLKWSCRQDPDKLKKKFDFQFLKDFTPSAIQTLPVAFRMILDKTLSDIGYPEKLTPTEKGKRIIFWIAGNIYRILRSQFANVNKNLSDRFKTITTIVDKITFSDDYE
ncbi:MAG: hypothetical protein GF329_15180 [Candidatus Lokiarchaeota archaeon]|nr:hypothetical protein [Candidatus Lokiarchaeota archaeon]